VPETVDAGSDIGRMGKKRVGWIDTRVDTIPAFQHRRWLEPAIAPAEHIGFTFVIPHIADNFGSAAIGAECEKVPAIASTSLD